MYGLEFPELNAVLADGLAGSARAEVRHTELDELSRIELARSAGPVQPIGQRDRKGSRGAQDGRKRPPPYPDPAQRLKGECIDADFPLTD